MTRRTTDNDPRKQLKRRLGRGASPHNSRRAGVRFEKGHAKRGGRSKGVPNKMTRDLKEAIFNAMARVGLNGRGKDGVEGFMTRAALKDLNAFLGLVRAFVPKQVEASIRHEKPYMTEAEIKAELKARGLSPHTIDLLRHHLVPAKDFDPYGDGDVDGKVIEPRPAEPLDGGEVDSQPVKPPAKPKE
jgi:hypothetical protein